MLFHFFGILLLITHFFILLKTSKNQRFSDAFRGIKREYYEKWVNTLIPIKKDSIFYLRILNLSKVSILEKCYFQYLDRANYCSSNKEVSQKSSTLYKCTISNFRNCTISEKLIFPSLKACVRYSLSNFYFLSNYSPLKTIKNAFFHLKSSFCS